jgi:hypothetical protein
MSLKINSPWKSLGLGILCVGLYSILQYSLSMAVPNPPNWIKLGLYILFLLSPLAFIPFVDRMSLVLVASLGSASTLLILISISTLFQNEYSSTDWRGVAIVISTLMGVSIFLASPIVYFRNRTHVASEQINPADS